jgi:hypothetical protein
MEFERGEGRQHGINGRACPSRNQFNACGARLAYLWQAFGIFLLPTPNPRRRPPRTDECGHGHGQGRELPAFTLRRTYAHRTGGFEFGPDFVGGRPVTDGARNYRYMTY